MPPIQTNAQGVPYGFTPMQEGYQPGPDEAVIQDERSGIKYTGPKSYFDGPSVAHVDLAGRADRSYNQVVKQAFDSPGAFVNALGAVYKKRFAEPVTRAVAAGVEQLNPLAANPFAVRQPGGVAQGIAETIVPQDLTTGVIQGATGGVGRAFSPALLGPRAAQQTYPRLVQGAKRVGAMGGAGAAGAALEGQDPFAGAIQGAAGQGIAEGVSTVTRLGKRFAQKEGPVYTNDAQNFVKTAEDAVLAFKNKTSSNPTALADFGKTRGRSLLNKWYGDEVKNIGKQIDAGIKALPATQRQQLGTFDPSGYITDFPDILSRKQEGLAQSLRIGQRLSWTELMDAYQDIAKRAFSEAERKTIIKGKPTDMKIVWQQMTEYITSTLKGIQNRLPGKPDLTGAFADMKDQYTKGSAVIDMLRTSVKGSSAGSQFVTSKLQRAFSEDLPKAAALEGRLGSAKPAFERAITRGAGFGALDVSKEGPTPFLSAGGPMARLREYLKFPEFIGYPQRPYDLSPEWKRILGHGAQGAIGREVQK